MTECNYFYEVSIFVFLLLSAFFSGAETALVSARRETIEVSARRGSGSAKKALVLLDNIEESISMILLGNNIANVAASAFITYLAAKAYMISDRNLFYVTAVQTAVFLIFGEITPKLINKAKGEGFLLLFAVPLNFMRLAARPFSRFSLGFTGIMKSMLRVAKKQAGVSVSRDEIRLLFTIGEEEGLIEEEHRMYVSEILQFRLKTVQQIMVPIVDITSVEINSSLKKLCSLIEETRYSRIPVYERRVDNIVGYVFYRDILRNRGESTVRELMNEIQYVPETKNVFELFIEMQENSLPVVFVVNEYGGITGMVTHEDIAEEVVGEIQSNDHNEEDLIIKTGTNEYTVSGYIDIEHLQKVFPVQIQKKGFETLAGFLEYHFGKIPRKGEKLVLNRVQFIVDESDSRSIDRVVVKLPARYRNKASSEK